MTLEDRAEAVPELSRELVCRRFANNLRSCSKIQEKGSKKTRKSYRAHWDLCSFLLPSLLWAPHRKSSIYLSITRVPSQLRPGPMPKLRPPLSPPDYDNLKVLLVLRGCAFGCLDS